MKAHSRESKLSAAGKKCALVTGASGIQGLALLKKMVELDDWSEIYAVSRSELPISSSKLMHCPLDLNDKEALTKSLKESGGSSITHFFHLAFQGDMSNVDKTTFIWMVNIVETLEKLGAPLQHVYFTQGHLAPNFYYDQEDWAIERVQSGAGWTWSATRPSAILGYSQGFMNMVQFMATYGTLCKELNAKFRFPGAGAAFMVLNDSVDVDLLMECALWLTNTPSAHNTSYNISNGDAFRFSQLWPAFAEWFGVELASPLKIPLIDFLPQHEGTWQQIREKYKLKDIPFEKMAQAKIADMAVNFTTDGIMDVTKLKQAGFIGMKLRTKDVYIKWFNFLANEQVIPDYPAMRRDAKD